MRRMCRAPVRPNKAKLNVLVTNDIDAKTRMMIPPSLKSDEVVKFLRARRAETEGVGEGEEEDTEGPKRKIMRKRSTMGKDESPRSGLKPQHIHSTRSRSEYGLLTTNKLQAEYRKLSDFGVAPPSSGRITTPSLATDRPVSAPNTPSEKKSFKMEPINPTFLLQVPETIEPSTSQIDEDENTEGLEPKRLSIRQKIRSLKLDGNQAMSSFKKSISFNENATVRRFHASFRKKKQKKPDDDTRSEGAMSNSEDRRSSMFVKRGSISCEEIKKVNIEEEYTMHKELASGRFGYIHQAQHNKSGQKIAIKMFPRTQIKQSDFIREYNYSFFLSPHQNIIDTFEGTFYSSDEMNFFFVQEFCPYGSLREAVDATRNGLSEENTRSVMLGILAAIEYLHGEGLVHRNLKAENVLLFDDKNFSKVKITDFGLTRKVDTAVKYLEFVNTYHAPELCETVVNEVLTVCKSADVWAIGVLFYYCLKGRFPWQKASIMCRPYWEWEQWLKGKNPTLPKRWYPFSEKALKIMKKSLNPRVKDRWTVKDIRKIVAKEKLLKPPKPDTSADFVYIPLKPSKKKPKKDEKKRSALQQWLCATLNTMSEISEQMVSARDED